MQHRNLKTTELEDYCHIYLDDIKYNVSEKVLKKKNNVIFSHIVPYFPGVQLWDITVKKITDWLHTLKEEGSGYSTILDYQKEFKALLNHAVKNYGLISNPFTEKYFGDNCKKTIRPHLIVEDYVKLASLLRRDNRKTYIPCELMFWTGMKEGEVFALRPSDFDFICNTVSVYNTRDMNEVIKPIALEHKRRVVGIPESLANEIKNSEVYNDAAEYNDYMFAHVRKDNLCRDLSKYCTLAGISVIKAEDLRTSFICFAATRLKKSASAIAEMLGYNMQEIYKNYYSFFSDEPENFASETDLLRTSLFSSL